MKKIILLALSLYFSASVSAQIDSVLFGLSRISNTSSPVPVAGGTVYLAKINASSGLVNNVSPSSVGTGIQLANAAIDSYNMVYYYVNMNGHIVGLSLATGAIVSSAAITNANADHLDQMIYNCSDTTIYGLARVSGTTPSTTPSVFLAKINPATGVVSNISPGSVGTGIQLMDAAIDPYNKIYYFVNMAGNIVGLSLTTGTIVSSHLLTNANAPNLSQMIYNRTDSTIYGLARGITNPSNPSTGYVYLAKVDPATGIVTNISPSSIATGIMGSIGTIDPYNKIFYFADMNGTFKGVSLLTGMIVSNPTISFTNAQYLDQVFYNCNFCPLAKQASSTTSGLIDQSTNKVFKMYPNPSNSDLSVEFEKPGNYKIEIINSLGRVVLSEVITNEKNKSLKTSTLTKGVYYCVISGSNNDKIASQKVIID